MDLRHVAQHCVQNRLNGRWGVRFKPSDVSVERRGVMLGVATLVGW